MAKKPAEAQAKADAEAKANAEAKAKAEAQTKPATDIRLRAEMASASTSSAGTINLPGLTSLNSKVDILVEITKELVGQMGDLVEITLPSLKGAIAAHSSDLKLFKDSTSKIIKG